jgi:hypothetical protein
VGAWEEIRQEIKEKVDRGPCATWHLCPSHDPKELAIFYKIVKGMIRRKEIKYEWYLTGKPGRPRRVLSNRNVEEHKRWHEVYVTSVLQALGFPFRRLDDVDKGLLPDFELDIWGELVYGEFDTGSERGVKIEDRLSKYHAVGDRVFWIVPSEARRESLRAKDLNPNSYFGVFDDVVNNPLGAVWLSVTNRLETL